MADYNLGTARGVIEIEYRGNGPQQAQRDMRGLGGAAEDANQRMSRAGNQLAGTGAVIATGLGLAVKSAADFEKQLSNVAAVSGATDAEMEQLRNKSLQLGKDTQFSASESASAIEELVKAGVSVQDVMNGAADATVALAAAGGVSMPEAASQASNAMNQFNLAASDLPRVADLIAGAANASAIDVKDFGYSLGQVGAVANLAGATFDDTAAAIALMGNAGIKGSDAGTSLKSMLMNLQPTTEKQTNLMEELGIVTEDGANAFYDAEGNLKSLADVSGVLQKALKGQTKAQQQATLETLFGSDGIRAAAIMANNGAEGFDKMATSMGKVTAADVAAKRMDNLAGSIEMLKGSLETLMIQIGTPLLNGIRMLVDALSSVINIVLELPGPVLEAVTTFAALLAGGLLLVGGFLKLKAAFIAFRAGALLITGPVGLIVAAIAALVAAFLYFYKTNAKFRAFVQQIAAVLKEQLARAIEYLVPLLKQFGAFMVKVFQAALPYIKQFGVFLVNSFNAALPTIKKIITFLGELADMFMKYVVPAIREAAGSILDGLVGAFQMIWPEIQKMIPAVQDFVMALVGLFQTIIGSTAFQFLITTLKILAGVFVSTILPLLIRLGGIFYNVFVTILGNAIRTALAVVRNVLGIISGVIKVFTGIFTGDFRKAWEGVKQIFRSAAGVILAVLRGMWKNVGTIIRGLGQTLLAGVKAIPGLLRGVGGLFLAAGRGLIDQFVNGMKNAAGIISGIAGNVWDSVRSLLNGAIDKINAAVEFTIDIPGPNINVNPPNIPHLATGGVTNGPMISVIGDNRGGQEVVSPLDELWRQMDKIYAAGKTSMVDAEMASAGRGSNAGGSGQPGRARLLEGTLSIDKSGRAYIRGVAEDVYDGNERFTAAHGRMNH